MGRIIIEYRDGANVTRVERSVGPDRAEMNYVDGTLGDSATQLAEALEDASADVVSGSGLS